MTILPAFSEAERQLVFSGLETLAILLRATPGGGKMEEGYWTTLYCRAKQIPEPGWSNLAFKDVRHDGLGVEFKLLGHRSPSGAIGTRVMHPAATRKIAFAEREDPNTAMAEVMQRWNDAISKFDEEVAATSATGASDLRWGILLWKTPLTEFLYFEERLIAHDVANLFATWSNGSARGRPSRNLWIYERATGDKLFSVTVPENGAKLQPYFRVPSEAEGSYLFKIPLNDLVPVALKADIAHRLTELAAGRDLSDFLRDLVG